MTYYIHDFYHDTWNKFDEWWDLIEYIHDKNVIDSIGHNYNDTLVSINFGMSYSSKKVYLRNLIIYDSIMRVVNIENIRSSLQVYKPKQKIASWWVRRYGTFHYRFDPVPGTSGYRSGSCIFRYNIRRNKSYATKLQEYRDLFPNDDTCNKRLLLVKSWSDDLGRRSCERSWKSQTKKRKQWM